MGFKNVCCCIHKCLIHNFEIYVGKHTLSPSEHRLGVSGDVVMHLVDCVPQHENYKVA